VSGNTQADVGHLQPQRTGCNVCRRLQLNACGLGTSFGRGHRGCCCFQIVQDLDQRVMGLFAMCRVQCEPHSNGTSLARLDCLHTVIVACVEADHATTFRLHRRLQSSHTHTHTHTHTIKITLNTECARHAAGAGAGEGGGEKRGKQPPKCLQSTRKDHNGFSLNPTSTDCHQSINQMVIG